VTESLTAALAATLEQRRRELAPEALAAAKGRLLHALGISIAGRELPSARAAWDVVGHEAGVCVALGHRATLSPSAAAFYNGVAGHSSLQEDTGPGGLREGSHPGTYVIPAALAAADAAGASGRRLLEAIVIGYEAVSIIGDVAPPELAAHGFRPLGLMGAFGAAAAAATILGPRREQLDAALAIAANLVGGLPQGIADGTIEPYLHAGCAARDGLLAAQLAAAGAPTSPAGLDGPYGFFATYARAGPVALPAHSGGAALAVSRVGTKRYAACLQNQETIHLIVSERPPDVDAARIARVIVRRPERGANGFTGPGLATVPPFHTMLQTQMSARFTAAAALLGRPVEDARYFAAAHHDAEATALAARVALEPSRDASVTVEIAVDGCAPVVLHSDGSDALFPSAAEIRSLFVTRTTDALGVAAEEAAAAVDELEALADSRALTALLAV
jgi:2-methylcitrate dehydratase PrpD